jgi:hypothetical protein
MNKAYPIPTTDHIIVPEAQKSSLEFEHKLQQEPFQQEARKPSSSILSCHRGYEKPLALVKEGLTDEEHFKFSTYFRVFDEDEIGYCIVAHAIEIIVAVKGDSIKETIEATLLQLDENQDGLIQYEEFASAMFRKEEFGIILSEVAERLLQIRKTNDYIVTTKSSLQTILAETNFFIPKIYVLDITDSILRSRRIYYLTRLQRLFLTFDSTNSRVSCIVSVLIVSAVLLSVVAGMLATIPT